MALLTRNRLSASMCRLIPMAHERAVRGAELVATGKVTRIADGRQFFVAGHTSAYYVVDLDAGTCNCPDGRAPKAADGRRLCKHMCAALLSK